MGIREKRLENDFKELSQLVGNSGGTLAIVSTQGKPVEIYKIEYRCKGIESVRNNQPVYRTTHNVEITLGNNYPKDQPKAKFITDIFHPNVFSNKNVCLGSYWTMAENLSELVIRIGKIIQYSKDVLNLKSPANGAAKNWAENNMHLFAVDNQTFKANKKPTSTIVWNDFK
ncbi:ubiquitin-conjugating enzyme E2 [Calothrix sp. CCY 0018]|uniref:ubiquitin-conjugating enzyme E2 n=1 Tax=Calothrix sp. CCY 0018 TaxID=3103864 RepID=UPI0039C64C44